MKKRWLALVSIVVSLLLGCTSNNGWQNSRRDSAELAPKPQEYSEAVLQVYGADVYGWRGWFAIHTWIAAKPSNADSYTIYEVTGWRAQRGLPALSIREGVPDRYWFGAKPEVLLDKRGEGVDQLIAEIDRLARSYPWANQYRMVPGPNSNTFPSWIAEQIPELGLDLPLSAIGQSWRE